MGEAKRRKQLAQISGQQQAESPKLTLDNTNLTPLQEFNLAKAEIDVVLSRLKAAKGSYSRVMKSKSDGFYEIANLLEGISERHQESYSKEILEDIRYRARLYKGLGLEREICHIGKTNGEKAANLSLTPEDIIRFYNLLTAFLEEFSEFYSEEAIRLGKRADLLADPKMELPVDLWQAQPDSVRQTFLKQLSLSRGMHVTEEQYLNYGRARAKFIEVAKTERAKVYSAR